MSESIASGVRMSRRGLLRAGAALVAGGASARAAARKGADAAESISIGIYTDSHYADKAAHGTRYYRDSEAKLRRFVDTMNKAKVNFAIVLGDFKDKGSSVEQELAFLKHVESLYGAFRGRRHYVLGNHDMDSLSKEQFVDATAMPAPHYAFDAGAFRCVVLDANYRKDASPYKAGNYDWRDTWVPPDEQKWLRDELKAAKGKVLVFVHQPLDGSSPPGVKNGPDVRRLLERSGKVVAVFQGHNHTGAYRQIGGIHYFTLRAMVEGPGVRNNAFSLARVSPRAVRIDGFVRQPSFAVGGGASA